MSENSCEQFRKELNFRDLGGYATEDGRKIKHGIFYRSGAFSGMNTAEKKIFDGLGIRCVIDLRTEEENRRNPDPPLNMPVYRCSGVVSKGGEGIDFSPKGMKQIGSAGQKQWELLQKYYQEMPFQNPAFQMMMKQAEQKHVPLCIHCATGKDRTGVACMILLRMLGVNEETVLDDYMLSCVYRKKALDHILEKNKEEIKAEPILKKLLIMKDGVLRETGEAVLKNMHERYGSYAAYFENEFGLKEEQIQEMRDWYLE
ncbi:MAG: tyrosine-protein phosphatase [Solobacterium sp.]|jgi:protein-tyrosine phosphatase|nr:tyrosine-protein phosphatase [Solobacterium sp.]MCH4205409.1 tyrosine-protein phosphatase [Solobacterium sp.]MCH4226621.1 tyrosine-protein phosphatase [Solobacterium sp.]MCH4282096.1 tyrosine-protein phosphatase [Solobacterium sp.]